MSGDTGNLPIVIGEKFNEVQDKIGRLQPSDGNLIRL